ncbi:DUF4331 family protein [Flavobacterium capsici]|uniref:DUF4331 family protein n=1 Tax=Flavobacterium capsici TaxID=3075618 RepID=A0AA96EU03_9FLAO|nr:MULTISPECIES: DUF4331 family protein [unclassified Flavobacterium]WNM18216.1 DUF4331 family protein [Flavobacterium sp. PMR2A8]WNM22267.1 DUF4331 family protein [Flavobacterium sp. PMTSA4]
MKTNKYIILGLTLVASMLSVNCSDDSSDNSTDFSGTFVQQDQMGRPAINTVFVASGTPKDQFNGTIPSQMGANFQASFEARLLALNPGYTTNALGLDATTFTTVLATDVLNLSTSGTTTFFDGTNVLTGRRLNDDVIDVELLLLFGGPTGGDNAGLTSDHVDANDKPFLTSFPYLAESW